MITFDEACKQVGYDNKTTTHVDPQFKYYAYYNGTATLCDTRHEALHISANIEQVCVNQQEVDDYWKSRRDAESSAVAVWETHLRNEFCNLSDHEYKVCYNLAYDRKHSDGYNEVYYEMQSLSDFINQLKAGEV